MLAHLRAHLCLSLATLVLCAALYPAALLAVAQGVFPSGASGSLVARPDGTLAGSRRVAQAFSRDDYFWPRPSAAGYNAAAAGGSNWGASNPKLRDRVARQIGLVARYRSGTPVGPDVEAWFAADPGRAAKWAAEFPTSAANWASAGKSGDEYGPNGQYVLAWMLSHPEVGAAGAKPEEVLPAFFECYVKAHPGTFPVEGADKTVAPAKSGAAIREFFFDPWLRDPANAAKVAEIEPIPSDAVTASGSGLDPHITLRNARWQLPRVAAARAGADAAKRIEAVLVRNAAAPLGGLAGEPLVNVLEVNLALDAEFAGR